VLLMPELRKAASHCENILQHAGHGGHILSTGLPGVGKTILIHGLATSLAGYSAERPSDRDALWPPRYGVDVAASMSCWRKLISATLTSELFTIDEIGKITDECPRQRRMLSAGQTNRILTLFAP
jgi:nucleoside-triphosphatase THEP1